MELISNVKLKRNYMFCIISSLEMDLRNNILELINEGLEVTEDLEEKAIERYKKDNSTSTKEIASLINYLDFGDYSQIINNNIKIFNDKQKIKKLSKEIEKIVPIRNRVMHNRPLLPNDDEVLDLFVKSISNYKSVMLFNETMIELNKIKDNPDYLISYIPEKTTNDETEIKHNLPMVDYDDTGFIGRTKIKEKLKLKLLNTYPVITVVGVGGIGKTSLALSCIYDLIDEQKDNPNFYNTIIWITLKTKAMIDGDFISIKDAIISLDDKFKLIGKDFEDIKGENISDIIDYMTRKRTLLVIDNFETIKKENINDLFDNVPSGSKILITSRIGIGNYEDKVYLDELNDSEAIMYFRKLVNNYKVDSLIKKGELEVLSYIQRANRNPLAIKWLVINVGKGMSPENILNSKYKDLTTFCLSNIYEVLSNDAKYILKIILRKSNICSLAEIVFVSELSYETCVTTIYELFKSNFLKQNEDFSYSIPEFIVNFAKSQSDSIDYKIDNKIKDNINKLNGSLENLKKDIHLTNKYHPLSIFPKTNTEKIATIYILKAIEASKRKEYSKLDEYYDLAKETAPDFSDLYKIAGYLYSKISATNSERNYDIAIDLAEQKAPVYYFYAGHLINNQNYKQGEEMLLKAIELDQNNDLIKMKLARIYKMQHLYEESISLLSKIDINNKEFFDDRMKRKYIYEFLDTKTRFAEYLIDQSKEKAEAIIEEAIVFLDQFDKDLLDFTIYDSIFKLAINYIRLLSVSQVSVEGFIKFLVKYNKYILAVKKGHKKEKLFDKELNILIDKLPDDISVKIAALLEYRTIIKEKNVGEIYYIKENGYGFIRPISHSYQKIYFHASQFKGDFRKLEQGQKVLFELMVEKEKIYAVNVTLVEMSQQEKAEV